MKRLTCVWMIIGLVACAQDTPPPPIETWANVSLCESAALGSRYFSAGQIADELKSRSEECTSFIPLIEAKIQAREHQRQANNAARMQLGLQLLQMGQPKASPPPPTPFRQTCQTRFVGSVAYTDCY